MSVALVLLSLLAEGPVAPQIRADAGGCPDAAAVSQRLAGLLNSGGESAEPDLVDLTVSGPDLHLRLSRADGTLVAERRIPRSNRCAELADAVAALVAAWESDLRPEAPPPPVPAPLPPLPLVVREAPREQERASYEIGMLPALWLGGGRFSFAGTLRAGVWSRRAPVGMTLALSATFPVDSGDSGGLAHWRRHALSAGVMGRLRHRWLFVDGLAEAVLGWLVVNQEGAGDARASFDPGLTIGLRAGSRVARRLELYASLGAWGAAWTAADRPGAVPHWGLLTGLGGSFLFGL
jgi:hypothetical protein